MTDTHLTTPEHKKRARLVDVARLAGVSLGSASKAMSDPEAVRTKTLEAVQAAAKQLGYVPDGMARALAMRRSQMIGVVLPTISNPVYAAFVHILQRVLMEQGYHLLVLAHEYDRAMELALITRLVQRGVDGLVLIGTDHDPAVTELLAQTRLPHIFSWSIDEAAPEDCVGFSNRRAMQDIVQHLLQLGHRKFAAISGDVTHNERARARLAGVRDALHQAGIELPSSHILFTPFSVEGGRQGMQRVLALDPRPTALVCTTDLMAAGAMAEAQAAGLVIPDDLSITGFDDIDLASLMRPALTTVRAPIAAMGERVGQQIIAKIARGEAAQSETIATHLIVRESSAPPKV